MFLVFHRMALSARSWSSLWRREPDKLPIYASAKFESVRVDACDSCWTYLKSVDLTKDGRAVPLVGDIATVPRDIRYFALVGLHYAKLIPAAGLCLRSGWFARPLRWPGL